MQVDDQFLQAMGLDGLEGEQKQKALDDILFILDARVADRVAAVITPEQAAEFDKFDDNTADSEIAQWLDKNIPNRAQIIEEEAAKMRDEAQAIVKQAGAVAQT